VVQCESLFDVPPEATSTVEWDADIPIEDKPWNVGLIVGPSGSGKTTIANELFAESIVESFDWPRGKSLLDGFPAAMGASEITTLLSSVGFSSPPNWLRPFDVLSNGEQFRVTMARALAEARDLVVVDEFTSVVDRTVAKMGSAAIAKSVRRRNQKFVALACHFDIVEWLDPDWLFEPATGVFSWRLERRRPDITLTVRRVNKSAWQIFKGHHYLTGSHAKHAACFVAFIERQPVGFCSVLHYPHPSGGFWKEHRTVVLPDFQGVGIGNRLSDYVASLFVASGKSYRDTTQHPAHCNYRRRSANWQMARKAGFVAVMGNSSTFVGGVATASVARVTTGWKFVGKPNLSDAKRFNLSFTRKD
tara:strand:- start:2134 stop:3216 length:1083 start_codon:yes stop_codon:yes gene_type:complete